MSELNVAIWQHGIRNPPSRVKINVQKDDKGVVKAQLFGLPFEKSQVKREKKAAKKEPKSSETKTQEKAAAPKVAEPAKKAAPKKAVKKEAPATAQ